MCFTVVVCCLTLVPPELLVKNFCHWITMVAGIAADDKCLDLEVAYLCSSWSISMNHSGVITAATGTGCRRVQIHVALLHQYYIFEGNVVTLFVV